MNKDVKETKKQEILEAFHFRHACKVFDPDKKISDQDFTFILETARLSPSSFGYEPWKFVVIQKKELREKIKPYALGAQSQLDTASHFVIILSRNVKDMHYDSTYIQKMDDLKGIPRESQKMKHAFYKKFQEADFNLLQSDRAMLDWASKQTYIALANMMTSAAQIGIDSCPMEGFNKEKVEAVLKEEGILTGDNLEVSVMVAFGYRKEEQKHEKVRQPINDIVEWC